MLYIQDHYPLQSHLPTCLCIVIVPYRWQGYLGGGDGFKTCVMNVLRFTRSGQECVDEDDVAYLEYSLQVQCDMDVTKIIAYDENLFFTD